MIRGSPGASEYNKYRLRFEIHDPDGKLLLPGNTHPLSVFSVSFLGKHSVCLIHKELLSASEKSNEEEVCSHKLVAERPDIYWSRFSLRRRRRPGT